VNDGGEVGHANIENLTPFAFEAAISTDEGGRAMYIPVVKASYVLQHDDFLSIAEKQLPVNLAGEYWGEIGQSSYKYEPQCAFTKPATDIVLIGHACAIEGSATEVFVRFRVGPVDKIVRVTGDRYWMKSLGMISTSSPEPFEKIPLIYERAFGGWDRSHPDPDKHRFEPRNPVGTGFRSKHGSFEEGIRLPNLEDPRHPISNYGDTPPPAGFGFTSPDWQPRASFAGTYDERWMKERMPLLPKDFDRRFFNAASPGLIAPGYLKGDEPVLIENASPHGTLSFNLPGVPPPECRVQLVGRQDARVPMFLDTVIINTDEDQVLLLWRGHLPVRNGPHDLVSIQITAEGVVAPASAG
jgi:hypothetical protein